MKIKTFALHYRADVGRFYDAALQEFLAEHDPLTLHEERCRMISVRDTVHRQAGLKRLEEAQALLHHRPSFPSGAIYLGGYAVECMFKWFICQTAQPWPVRSRPRGDGSGAGTVELCSLLSPASARC